MPGRERGSATLEFALVLPILLVIVLALVQVGVILRDQIVLVEAARAGAREAAVTESDEEVREAVDRAASTLEVSRLEMRVEREGEQGAPVTVRLRYEDRIRIPMVRWLFPEVVELKAGATMRREYP